MDVSSRKLRYFVAVAEDLHFSRAAGRLFVTQQALSKQIRELEDDIGVRLLRRTTRSVELTPAGEVLLAAARRSLAELDAGVEAALAANRGESGTVKLGFVIGAALELTSPILAEFGRRHPRIRLDMREYGFADPSAGLADGSSEVAFVRLPISAPDIESEPLFVEPLVAALPSGHRWAGRSSIPVAEMTGEPLVVGRTEDASWRRLWTLDAHRDGEAARVVTLTSSHTEEMELVAAGRACAVTVAGAARYTPHRGVRYIPIDGVSGSTLAVAWRRGHLAPPVERFLEVTREVRARETAVVGAIEQPFPATHNQPL
ncbi:LysR substrate-binding domain-containing protein [Streptomyces sp. MZ04]|uniref:LysR family transcriptional regulator n=1 Tax=Streptomyces sp. MZ04 TaxID=2559236 RepID=UPI001FD76F59|nr:LysR substrate-binding domain-containing protein [Streptomyces sp. MZ04]